MKNLLNKSWQTNKLLVILGGLAGMVFLGWQSLPIQGQSNISGTIKIDGSSTVYPITKDVAKNFSTSNPAIKVDVILSGTSGGFKNSVRVKLISVMPPVQLPEKKWLLVKKRESLTMSYRSPMMP